MQIKLDPANIIGFPVKEIGRLQELLDIYEFHIGRNCEKDKYYEGDIPLSSVNLGIALPEGLSKLEIGCAWGAKAVDVLAARSMFDGFVGENGDEVEELQKIVTENCLITEYMKVFSTGPLSFFFILYPLMMPFLVLSFPT